MINKLYLYPYSLTVIRAKEIKGNTAKNRVVVCEYVNENKDDVQHPIDFFNTLIDKRKIIEL